MESQEAKLYRGNEYVKSLCLIGYNDDFDDKFRDACCHSSFESVLEDEIGSLYDKIKEYENILGY